MLESTVERVVSTRLMFNVEAGDVESLLIWPGVTIGGGI